MKDWQETLISPSTSILSAIKILDATAMQILLVVDDNKHLLGTVTDGDIRRGILKGISFEKPVTEIMKTDPIVGTPTQKRDEILNIMKEKTINQIPIISENNCVVNLEVIADLLKPQLKDNLVVLMAGGLGKRLGLLTNDCPKPLLKVGNKPILETILEGFIEQGFRRFYFALNYMAEKIQKYFDNGSRWDAEIRYIIEKKKMGTAGALGYLHEKPEKPFIVMNADLLTKIKYNQLLEFHRESNAEATMCIREYSYKLPYGVVRIDDNNHLLEIDEKPVNSYFVNAGIYVLSPEVLSLIPLNTYFDMPNLFVKMIKLKKTTVVFPIMEYWIDIGYYKDLEKANNEYEDVFR